MMMRRATAAAYLDMTENEFIQGVSLGQIPDGRRFVNRDRWNRQEIDDALTKAEDPLQNWRAESPLYRDHDKHMKEAAEARRAQSPQSLAKRWACSDHLVRTLIHSGKLKGFRYGKLLRVTPEEVARFEAAGGTATI